MFFQPFLTRFLYKVPKWEFVAKEIVSAADFVRKIATCPRSPFKIDRGFVCRLPLVGQRQQIFLIIVIVELVEMVTGRCSQYSFGGNPMLQIDSNTIFNEIFFRRSDSAVGGIMLQPCAKFRISVVHKTISRASVHVQIISHSKLRIAPIGGKRETVGLSNRRFHQNCRRDGNRDSAIAEFKSHRIHCRFDGIGFCRHLVGLHFHHFLFLFNADGLVQFVGAGHRANRCRRQYGDDVFLFHLQLLFQYTKPFVNHIEYFRLFPRIVRAKTFQIFTCFKIITLLGIDIGKKDKSACHPILMRRSRID